MSIDWLDPTNRADVARVSDLHLEYLPDSPIALMGKRFVRRFYYSKLVEDELVRCVVCKADGNVRGFVSYTFYPHDFMSRGIKKHYIYLTWLVSTSLLLNIRLAKNLVTLWRMMRERRTQYDQQFSAGLGEVISLVTESKYRSHVPPGGKSRLTVRLFEDMAREFQEAGFDRVRLLVQPDNRASNMFCNMMGCKFEKVSVAGMVTHQFIYDLPKIDSNGG